MKNFWSGKKLLVTGGAGFLGSHVTKLLRAKDGIDDIFVPRSKSYDLRNREVCAEVVRGMDIVIHLAATVGGIGYNRDKPGEIFYDNMAMGLNMIEESRKAAVKKFVSIGTICSYPKIVPIPFREEDLWNGYPEETNAPYGIAKKALLVQLSAYRQQYGFNSIYLLPINLYGPGDNFKKESSHVIPALIRKCLEAVEDNIGQVTVWGDGFPTREFLYVEDAAEAIVLATEKYDKPEPVNIGSGREISIKNLVTKIAEYTGFKGKVVWDTSKPNGQPRRRLDTSKAKEQFGFVAKTDFDAGLKKTIEWYRHERALQKN